MAIYMQTYMCVYIYIVTYVIIYIMTILYKRERIIRIYMILMYEQKEIQRR